MSRRRPTTARALLVITTVLVTTVLAACSGSSGSGGGQAPSSLTVFAASSLTNAFTAAGKKFQDETGTKVTFSFAGSQDLVAQVQQGAPADVLATADTTTMDSVSDELDAPSQIFASNKLAIAVAPGNPKHI